MIKEEKELLLKDLCARLSHGVIVQYKEKSYRPYGEYIVDVKVEIDGMLQHRLRLLDFKPYLRPLSSMTKEELQQLQNIIDECGISWKPQIGYDIVNKIYIKGEIELGNCIPLNVMVEIINWLNANHFDYRGLIEKGLAIEAPKNMYN